jgi:hypothetical protein
MAAVRLAPGTYEIEFRYQNQYFTAGLVISLLSLAAFISLMLFEKRPLLQFLMVNKPQEEGGKASPETKA